MIQYVCDRCHAVCGKDELTTVSFEIGDKSVVKDFCKACISDLLFEKFDFYKWRDEINKTMSKYKIHQTDIANVLKVHSTTVSYTLRTEPQNGLKSYTMQRIEDALSHLIKEKEE